MTTDDFTKKAIRTTVLVLGLLALNRLPAVARLGGAAQYIVDELRNDQLNAEDYHALAAGYYEGIEHVDRIANDYTENNDYHLRSDFLRYDFKPNLRRQNATGLRYTNSLGMANADYGYQKPPRTRRIAWLGDSVSTGPYGHSFPQLLESALNRDCLTPEIQKYELLNFSVPGYILLQKMDIALERAPLFHPDVYVVQLDSNEVPGARRHVGRMVARGTDLKYDFLRRMTAEAGVRSDDSIQTIIVKLKPFLVPMTREAVERIRDHAATEGAPVIVAFIPAAIDANATAEDFDDLHPGVDGLGLPIVDLRDTFRNANLHDLQAVPNSDIHPNIRGHKMIFDDLYAKLRANSAAWTALTGQDKVCAGPVTGTPPHKPAKGE
jgi:hypothetical protein